MTERYRHQAESMYSYGNKTKMENDFTPKKTMVILVIVVGCFAVLWPKVFYPMLVGSANQHIKPSAIDKTTGCCYVLSETDVDTIKIMSELCGNIIKKQLGDVPLTGRQIINICQDEVLRTCGIDISSVLQERVLLGRSTKQILDEVRSLNGSLCLKYNFGVPPWRLGVPHIITLKNISDSVPQERPAHVRSEMVHPAFRERGRAIPQASSPSRPPPRIVEGRPGPLPGMRPTIGGAGHVVPPSKQATGSMSVIMPIYTIGIVIFFTYTLMKIIFKKHPDTDTIYSTMEHDHYRKDATLTDNGTRASRDAGSCKLGWRERDAREVELDQLRRRLRETELAMERVVAQMAKVPLKNEHSGLSNGSIKTEEKPSVKIMGMETTESCEGGKKWQSSNSSVLPPAPVLVEEQAPPPKEIYLDRALPAQSQILVSDSAVETEKNPDDPAVVLAGKMTLSVISLENENLEVEEVTQEDIDEILRKSKRDPNIEDEINNIIIEAIENIENSQNGVEEIPEIEKKDITIDKHNQVPPEKPEINNKVVQKSSSEDSSNTVLTDSNQGSVIDLNINSISAAPEDDEYEEVSEEEIEISDEEEVEIEKRDITNNATNNHNNDSEDDESEVEIEEIIEYTDDEEEEDLPEETTNNGPLEN